MKPGFKVGGYVLERPLGEGGMAEVWLGRNPHIANVAAIKFLNQQFAHLPDICERFLNEGRRQGTLNHPNIVKVFGFEYVGAQGFLLLEYIDGDSLSARLSRGRMSDDEILRVSDGVLAALSCAHVAGIIHRDVKPLNILLDRRGEPHLTDFGIARAEGPSHLTRTNTRMGTPYYMSPEQIQRPKDVDSRADIYSFGVVLYEMLTGRLPFGEELDHDTSGFNVQLAHVQTPPPPPRSLNPSIQPAMEQLVLKCLAKQPGQRYSSCDEVQAALARAMAVLDPPTFQRQRTKTVLETVLEEDGPGKPPSGPLAVTLINSGPNRVDTFILTREVTGNGISETNKLLDNLPALIKYGVSHREAETIKAKFAAVGAMLQIVELPRPDGNEEKQRERSPMLVWKFMAILLVVALAVVSAVYFETRPQRSGAITPDPTPPPTPATSTLSGVVADWSGASIAQADLTLMNSKTGSKSTDKSDERGRYSFPRMQPGNYTLTAGAPGFSERVVRDIRLLPNTPTSIAVQLQVRTSTPPPAPQPKPGVLKMVCDMDCIRYVDGVRQSSNTVQVTPGTHEVRATLVADPDFSAKDSVSVEAGQTYERDANFRDLIEKEAQKDIAKAQQQFDNEEYSGALGTLATVKKLPRNNQDVDQLVTKIKGECQPLNLCGPQ